MNCQTWMFDNAPQSVRDFVLSTVAGKAIPDDTDSWNLTYAYTDSSDMDVVGFCACGDIGDSFLLVAQGVDSTVVTAVVAAASWQLTRRPVPVIVTSQPVLDVLGFLGIDANLQPEFDNGMLRHERVDEERLHASPSVLCDLPLAGHEEGEAS
jgi:hypothetical protein